MIQNGDTEKLFTIFNIYHMQLINNFLWMYFAWILLKCRMKNQRFNVIFLIKNVIHLIYLTFYKKFTYF